MTRRMVTAMLSGEVDAVDRSAARHRASLLASVLTAVIILAGTGTYGLLVRADTALAEGDVVIMQETGARFVLTDGTLHPVLNWTSVLLFVGNARPQVTRAPRAELSAYPVGAPIGIAGAPDPPPAASALLGLPWTLCSVPSLTGPGLPTPHLLIGQAPAGTPAVDPVLLVYSGTTADDNPSRYLLWQGRRFRIPDQTALAALDLATTRGIRVAAPVLDSFTEGPEIAVPKIAGQGSPSARRIGGAPALIGAVYRSGRTTYVLTVDGLAAVDELTARLLTAAGASPVEISEDEAARHVTRPLARPGFPAEVPALTEGHQGLTMVCASRRGDEADGRSATVLAYPSADARRLANAPGGFSPDGSQVVVRPGHGALVRAGADAALFLVTDQGVRHPVRNSTSVDTVSALGYDSGAVVSVPAAMLALVPLAATLDPAALWSTGSGTATAAPSAAPPSPSPSPSPSPRR